MSRFIGRDDIDRMDNSATEESVHLARARAKPMSRAWTKPGFDVSW